MRLFILLVAVRLGGEGLPAIVAAPVWCPRLPAMPAGVP